MAETRIPKRNDPSSGRLAARSLTAAICGRSEAIWALVPNGNSEKVCAYAAGAGPGVRRAAGVHFQRSASV
jgi:hypothetical protein